MNFKVRGFLFYTYKGNMEKVKFERCIFITSGIKLKAKLSANWAKREYIS